MPFVGIGGRPSMTWLGMSSDVVSRQDNGTGAPGILIEGAHSHAQTQLMHMQSWGFVKLGDGSGESGSSRRTCLCWRSGDGVGGCGRGACGTKQHHERT